MDGVYLSRLDFNNRFFWEYVRNKNVFSDERVLHSVVRSLYPVVDGFKVLYFVDSRRGSILLQSNVLPKDVLSPVLVSKDIGGVVGGVLSGDKVVVDVRLNMVVKRARDGVFVGVPSEQRVDWVADKVSSFVRGDGLRVSVGECFTVAGPVPLRVADVRFEGFVSDEGRFRDVWLSGLGRGKAYGCGLLRVYRGV